MALHAIEDAHAAGPGQSQFKAEPPAHAVAYQATAAEALARSRNARVDRSRPTGGQPSRRQIGFAGTCRLPHITRYIQPSLRPVAPQVLPEIRELERCAQGI